MTDELVKRLRAYNDESFVETLCGEAADRIEQLTEELSACTESPGGCGYWRERSKALTTERDEALECNEEFFVDNQFLKKRVEKAEAERDRLRHAIMFWLKAEEPDVDAAINMMRAALKGETP